MFSVYFHIFEFEYVRICFVCIFHLFIISFSQCAPKGSAEQLPAHFSRLASAQFSDYITRLATNHFVLVSTDTAFLPVHSL